MKQSAFLIICCFSISITVKSQFFKHAVYKFEAGTGISFGPQKIRTIESPANYLTFNYFQYKRYRVPALRIRASICQPVNTYLTAGIRSGIDIHYLERKPNGNYENNVAVPLQAVIESQVLKLRKQSTVVLGAVAGYNFKSLNYHIIKEKGGLTGSIEISLRRSLAKRFFYYKTGFEYSEDNCRYYYKATNNFTKDEVLKYKQRRRLVLLAIGISF